MNALSAESCRIERWRGYLASSFYVRLPDQTVLESPSFRWRHRAPPPDAGAARAAYDELAGRLQATGWMRDGDGADWFATVFTRLAEHRDEIPLLPDAELVRPQSQPIPFVAQPLEPPREHSDADLSAAREPLPPEPVSHPWRLRVALAAAAALVAAALASAIVLRQDGDGRRAGARRTAPLQAVRVRPTKTSSAAARVTKTAAQAPAPTPAKRLLVDVRVAAHGSGSWVEVRRSSATGPVLYRATLTDGQTLHVRAPKLWARFGAASNLTITSNGRSVHLQGTYDKLFVPSR
jgi:hypothetical protein